MPEEWGAVKMKYQLAIFDMDGTILDTLEDLAAALNNTLQAEGFPARSIDEVRRFVGNGVRRLIISGAPDGVEEEVIDRMFDRFGVYYGEHCADKTCAFDGILPMLSRLRKAGYKLAVVSNKIDFAVQKLVEQYFPDCFDVAVGERKNIRRKPAPDSVNEVLRLLNTDRQAAVYIGDSEVDIETAQNARMDGICVNWGFRDAGVLMKKGASIVVSSPKELECILLSSGDNI